MKTNQKKSSGGGAKAAANKIQKKPQFKQNQAKKGNKKPNGGQRNQFTMAENRRIERIREQNERKADKEAKLMLAQKNKKRKEKIFAKKTKRGQPLMKGRMELLLEKIEKRVQK